MNAASLYKPEITEELDLKKRLKNHPPPEENLPQI